MNIVINIKFNYCINALFINLTKGDLVINRAWIIGNRVNNYFTLLSMA